MTHAPEIVEIAAPGGPMTGAVRIPERSDSGPAPGVLVLMDAYGVNDHVKAVVGRLADQGYAALAPDLYYRERRSVVPYDEHDRAAGLIMRTVALSDAPEERVKDERVLADIEVGLEALKAHPGVARDRTGVLGFGMGGRLAFLAACRAGPSLGAAVSFYGSRIVPVVEQARSIRAPVLLHFGAHDASVRPAEIDRIQAELAHHGATHEVIVHPQAGPGFFCDDRSSYQPEAAATAWSQTLAWLGKYL